MYLTIGSWDGQIKLWAINPNLRSFSPAGIASIPVAGFINSMQFISLPAGSIDSSSWSDTTTASKSKQDIVLVAAVSQEPRLGRWIRNKEAKNGALVIHLTLQE